MLWTRPLPQTRQEWQELLHEIAHGSHDNESAALELKGSNLDPSTKPGRAVIAKFIIGAINRVPDDARREFGGHSILAIGIEDDGSITGIQPRDISAIEDGVNNLIGGEPVTWNTQWVPAEDGEKSVLFVIVTHTEEYNFIRWAAADCTDKFNAGTVYYRSEGSTRRAGDNDWPKIKQAITQHSNKVVKVRVHIPFIKEETVKAVAEEARQLISAEAKKLRMTAPRDQIAQAKALSSLAFTPQQDRPTPHQYIEAVNNWETAISKLVGAIAIMSIATETRGFPVVLENLNETYLKDIEVVAHMSEASFKLLDVNTALREEIDEKLRQPRRPMTWEETVQEARSFRFQNTPSSINDLFGQPKLWDVDNTVGSLTPSVHVAPRDQLLEITSGTLRPLSKVEATSSHLAIRKAQRDNVSCQATATITAAEIDKRFDCEVRFYEVPLSENADIHRRILKYLRS